MLLTEEDIFEEREFGIKTFVGNIDMDPLKIIGSTFSFALGNAGVDNGKLYDSFVNKLPSSEEELTQLMGRFGRRVGSSPAKNIVGIVCTLEGYQSILCRINFSISKLKSTKKNQETTELLAKRDLLSVLCLLVLQLRCFQAP